MRTEDLIRNEPPFTVDNPRYPEIEVQLSGQDGNAGAIIGSVTRELRRAGAPSEELTEFRLEAMSGDYDNVLRTAMRWVDVF